MSYKIWKTDSGMVYPKVCASCLVLFCAGMVHPHVCVRVRVRVRVRVSVCVSVVGDLCLSHI